MNTQVESGGLIGAPARVSRRPRRDQPPINGVRILKFGGSSLATPDCIANAASIVVDAAGSSATPVVVVVSAFLGVTNQLLHAARLAADSDGGSEVAYRELAARHHDAIDRLLAGDGGRRVREGAQATLDELRHALEDIRAAGEAPPAALDDVASVGERLSAIVVAGYLNRFRRAENVDARLFVTTDCRFTHARVMTAETNRRARSYFASLWRRGRSIVPVVTGFIGRTVDGRTTTVGRNGSDYSAAIVGAALEASVVEIWTDVDGVLSADPREVGSAVLLPQLTYAEALEMSRCGAKVLHADAIGPAVSRSIPIVVKNSFKPSAPGTRISVPSGELRRAAAGIACGDEVTLFTLEETDATAPAAPTERICRALTARGVEVVFLSHASWTRSVCVAVRDADASAAADVLGREFGPELADATVAIRRTDHQSVVSVVADGIQKRADTTGTIFGALGRREVTVSAITQGIGGGSLSFVVDRADRARAVAAVHRRLFGPRVSLALALIGVGNVGAALLRQLRERRDYLADQGFDVRVVAVADSKRFCVDRDGVDLRSWRETLDASQHRMDPRELTRALTDFDLTHAAVIDCTADVSIVDAYEAFIAAGLHIITPNKRANVLPWSRYRALTAQLVSHRRHFLYETNVAAGLPVMTTLRNLVAAGDAITKVEGILSGTLGYLFNTFDGRAPFSALVRDAHRMGYTEPDPRDDLSGRDVARKLLILARHMGLAMEMEDVAVDSLVSDPLAAGLFCEEFYAAYAAHDADLHGRLDAARARGTVLRYVGTIENGRAHAGIRELPPTHPFATTRGTDNVVAFTTARCGATLIVVQGPGAGADVTAMGVFADIMRLLHYLPQ